MNDEVVQILFDSYGRHTDLENADQLKQVLELPEGRKAFFDSFGRHTDLENFSQFENVLGVTPSDPIDTIPANLNLPVEDSILNVEVTDGERITPQKANLSDMIRFYVGTDEEAEQKIQELTKALETETDPETRKVIEGTLSAMDNSRIKTFGNNIVNGFVNTWAAAVQDIGIAARFLNEKFDLSDKELNEYFTYQVGKNMRDWADETFPNNPLLREEFVTSVMGQGAGSFMGFIGGGFIGRTYKVPGMVQKGLKKLPRIGKTLAKGQIQSGALLLGAQSMGADAYLEALEAGASEEDAFAGWAWNHLIGTTESVPISMLFSRVNKATGGSVQKTLARFAQRTGVVEGLGEGLQESISTFFQNLTAQQIYDESRKLHQTVGQGGLAGFALGALASAIGVNIKRAMNNRNLTPQEMAQLEEAVLYNDRKETEYLEKVDEHVRESEIIPENEEMRQLREEKAKIEKDIALGNLNDSGITVAESRLAEIDFALNQMRDERQLEDVRSRKTDAGGEVEPETQAALDKASTSALDRTIEKLNEQFKNSEQVADEIKAEAKRLVDEVGEASDEDIEAAVKKIQADFQARVEADLKETDKVVKEAGQVIEQATEELVGPKQTPKKETKEKPKEEKPKEKPTTKPPDLTIEDVVDRDDGGVDVVVSGLKEGKTETVNITSEEAEKLKATAKERNTTFFAEAGFFAEGYLKEREAIRKKPTEEVVEEETIQESTKEEEFTPSEGYTRTTSLGDLDVVYSTPAETRQQVADDLNTKIEQSVKLGDLQNPLLKTQRRTPKGKRQVSKKKVTRTLGDISNFAAELSSELSVKETKALNKRIQDKLKVYKKGKRADVFKDKKGRYDPLAQHLSEELGELDQELKNPTSKEHLIEELGDVIAQAHLLGVDLGFKIPTKIKAAKKPKIKKPVAEEEEIKVLRKEIAQPEVEEKVDEVETLPKGGDEIVNVREQVATFEGFDPKTGLYTIKKEGDRFATVLNERQFREDYQTGTLPKVDDKTRRGTTNYVYKEKGWAAESTGNIVSDKLQKALDKKFFKENPIGGKKATPKKKSKGKPDDVLTLRELQQESKRLSSEKDLSDDQKTLLERINSALDQKKRARAGKVRIAGKTASQEAPGSPISKESTPSPETKESASEALKTPEKDIEEKTPKTETDAKKKDQKQASGEVSTVKRKPTDSETKTKAEERTQKREGEGEEALRKPKKGEEITIELKTKNVEAIFEDGKWRNDESTSKPKAALRGNTLNLVKEAFVERTLAEQAKKEAKKKKPKLTKEERRKKKAAKKLRGRRKKQLKKTWVHDIFNQLPEGMQNAILDPKMSPIFRRLLASENVDPKTKELILEIIEQGYDNRVVSDKEAYAVAKGIVDTFGNTEAGMDALFQTALDQGSEVWTNEAGIGTMILRLTADQYEQMGLHEKAAKVDKYLAKKSTVLGRLISRLREEATPEARLMSLRNYYRVQRTAALDKKMGRSGKRVRDRIAEIARELDVTDLTLTQTETKLDQEINKALGTEVDPKKLQSEKIKAKIEKGNALIKQGLTDFRKSAGLGAGPALSKEGAAALGKILRGLALKFSGNLDRIRTEWNKDLKQAGVQDPDSLWRKMKEEKPKIFSEIEEIRKRNAEEIKRVIKDHYKKESTEDLKTKLRKLGLSDALAGRLANSMQKAIQEELRKKSDKIAKVLKTRKAKKKINTLLEAASTGVLTTDRTAKILSDAFGIPYITEGESKHIEELRQNIEEATTNTRRKAAEREMLTFLRGMQLNNRQKALDLFMDSYYINILSGFSTASVAGIGATLSLAGELAVALTHQGGRTLLSKVTGGRVKPGAPLKAFSRMFTKEGMMAGFQLYADVIRTGSVDFTFADIPIKSASAIDQIIQTEWKDSTALGKAGKLLFTLPGYFYRNLLAMDAMLKSGAVETFAYIEAHNKVFDQMPDVKKGSLEYRNALAEMYGTTNRQAKVEQVKRELEEKVIDRNERHIRLKELILEDRDGDVTENANQRALEAILMNTDVSGLIPAAAAKASQMMSNQDTDNLGQSIAKTSFRILFPIIRVPANQVNRAWQFAPINLIQRAAGLIPETHTGIKGVDAVTKNLHELGMFRASVEIGTGVWDNHQISPEERNRQLVRGAMGTAAMIALWGAVFGFGDDENEAPGLNTDGGIKILGGRVRVTAGGPEESFARNKAVLGQDWHPWKLQWKKRDGTWSEGINFLDTPLALALAPVGVYTEKIMTGRSFEGGPEHFAAIGAQALYDGSFAYSIQQTGDLFAALLRRIPQEKRQGVVTSRAGIEYMWVDDKWRMVENDGSIGRPPPASIQGQLDKFFKEESKLSLGEKFGLLFREANTFEEYKFQKAVAGRLAPIIPGIGANLYKQAVGIGKDLADAPIKVTENFGDLLWRDHLFGLWLVSKNPAMTDIFGYPIERDMDFPFVPSAVEDFVDDMPWWGATPDKPEWDIFKGKRPIWPKPYDGRNIKGINNAEKRRLDTAWKESFRKQTNENAKELKTLDGIELQEALDKMYERAKKDAQRKEFNSTKNLYKKTAHYKGWEQLRDSLR